MNTIDIDGCPLHVSEAGAGRVVLLIHGTAANLWGQVPPLLADDHRVVSYDRRSFGLSTAPPVASLRQHTLDAGQLLDKVGAIGATVVGWSVGGLIALDLAGTRPDLVEAAVVLEAPLFAKRHPRPEMLTRVVAAKICAATGHPRQGAEQFLRWALTRRGERNDFDSLPASWREAMMANARSILREIDAGTGEQELSHSVLAGITCPVLWLVGDRSAQSFSAAASRAEREHPQFSFATVPGSGHVMQHDRPDAVGDAVRTVEAMASR